jgi:hypothetical protein
MDNIVIPASERSPDVELNFSTGKMKLRGESYPEDVAAFYGPVMAALNKYLGGLTDADVCFDIELVYFNSSSAKALMNLLLLLEKAGAAGNRIVVNWHFSSDDDTMQEFGEDFSEDLEHVKFNLCAVEAA